MILIELAIALCSRSYKYPVFKVGVFKNKYLWYALISSFALQLLILYVPGIQTVFDVHAPEPMDWVIAAIAAAIVFSAIELGKYIACKRRGDM
jgi:magnesium-transporting ATPase (P-type)